MKQPRLLVLLTFTLWGLIWGSASARFEWRDVVTEVEILPGGDVIVTDERTLWTDEDFGEAFICVLLEPGESLTLLEGGSLSHAGSRFYQQPCASGAAGQEIIVAHAERVQESRVRYRYRLEGTTDAYQDVVEWYWNILESDHAPIFGYRLRVAAPGPMALPYDAFVHSPGNPESLDVYFAPDRSALEVTFGRIPDGYGVEVRYLMDPALFTLRGSAPGLESLLRDEAQLTGVLERERAFGALRSHPAWMIVPLALVLLLGAGILRAYRRFGREPGVDEAMKYPFEPPSDLPPAAVPFLVAQHGPSAAQAFHATVMDLARRGYGEFGGKNRKFEMMLDTSRSDEGLEPFEASVLDYLRRAAASGDKREGFLGLGQRPQDGLEKAHLEFDELKRYSQQHLAGFMSRWSASVKDWTETRFGGPLTSAESRSAAFGWFGLALLVAALCFGGQSLAFGAARAAFIVGAVLAAGLGLTALLTLPAWRKDLAPEIQGWLGFKRTLSDYTRMKDAPDDFFKLWDRYYVYAAALGVAQRFLKNLERAAPQHNLDETSLVRQASWMGSSGNLSSLSSFSSSVSSLSSALSSVSASSGGSSGGGGGGGGGGSSGGR